MDDAVVEFQRRMAAKDSLEKFRQYIEPSGHPDFQYPHAKHHAVLAEALEAMVRGELQRMIVMMPPGSAKSTIGSVQFLSWYASLRPNEKILAVSSTQALAESFARRRRATCYTQEWQTLSGTCVHSDMQSVGSFGYGLGGEQYVAGVGASVVGRRAQMLVVDDSVSSYEEINSEHRRNAMWEWYLAELRSRLTPGGTELMIGTRWHAMDLIGRLLNSEGSETWHVIRMPMLCDDPETDPMGREFGEPLWPNWFNQQQIDENKRHPLRWSSMYQQVPLTGDGSWLALEDVPVVDYAPKDITMWAAMDFAMTDGAGDFSVIIIAGLDTNRTLFIMDIWRDRVSSDKIVKRLVDLHKTYKFREVLVDNDAGTKVFKSLAHDIMRRDGHPVPLKSMPTGGQNKETRAGAFRGFAKMGAVRIVRGAWNCDLLSEIEQFPNGSHDDQIDCLTLLGRRMQSMGTKKTLEGRKTAPEIPRQVQFIDGKFVLANDTLDSMHEDRAGGSRFNKDRI